jgi:hypothetical protein
LSRKEKRTEIEEIKLNSDWLLAGSGLGRNGTERRIFVLVSIQPAETTQEEWLFS